MQGASLLPSAPGAGGGDSHCEAGGHQPGHQQHGRCAQAPWAWGENLRHALGTLRKRDEGAQLFCVDVPPAPYDPLASLAMVSAEAYEITASGVRRRSPR